MGTRAAPSHANAVGGAGGGFTDSRGIPADAVRESGDEGHGGAHASARVSGQSAGCIELVERRGVHWVFDSYGTGADVCARREVSSTTHRAAAARQLRITLIG